MRLAGLERLSLRQVLAVLASAICFAGALFFI
jgi:hypothetical protein